jgi:hypothetical protein
LSQHGREQPYQEWEDGIGGGNNKDDDGDDHRDDDESYGGEITAAGVVHAFCDPLYNRSSFHLAGTPDGIVKVVSQLALEAHKVFRSDWHGDCEDDDDGGYTCRHPHPAVGIVDHVAVMPLVLPLSSHRRVIGSSDEDRDSFSSSSSTSSTAPSSFVCGSAAIRIGEALRRDGPNDVRVLYYGDAHPDKLPLAQVRREQTDFFSRSRYAGGRLRRRRDPLIDDTSNDGVESVASSSSSSPSLSSWTPTTVVGAPPRFVENWNVRLDLDGGPEASRNRSGEAVDAAVGAAARSLVRYLRRQTEVDGGSKNRRCRPVEALALPRSPRGQWEVACNLLHPELLPSSKVDELVERWISQQRKQIQLRVVESYRVGTTAGQCLEAAESAVAAAKNRSWKIGERNGEVGESDRRVLERFLGYLPLR